MSEKDVRARDSALTGGLCAVIFGLLVMANPMAREVQRGEITGVSGTLGYLALVVGYGVFGTLLGWAVMDLVKNERSPRFRWAGLVAYPLLFAAVAAYHWPLPAWFCWQLAAMAVVAELLHLALLRLRPARPAPDTAGERPGDAG